MMCNLLQSFILHVFFCIRGAIGNLLNISCSQLLCPGFMSDVDANFAFL
jgi:hypothetical protein